MAPCVVLVLACGPSRGQHEESHSAGETNVTTMTSGGSQGPGASETGTQADSSPSTSSEPTGTSSVTDDSSTGVWVDPDCPDVHEGDLIVDPMTDIDALRFTGRVNGHLIVDGFDGGDLEFLSCLHIVEDGVGIQSNPNLTSLVGLDNLGYIGTVLSIHDNPDLTSLAGMGPVMKLLAFYVYGNASLASLDLPDLQTLDGDLVLGLCAQHFPEPLGDNPNLETLDGLTSLTSIWNVSILSQSSFASISRLHEIAAAGGLPASESFVNLNPMLPFEDVELLIQLAGLGEHDLYHCGNLGEPETNGCNCPNPG